MNTAEKLLHFGCDTIPCRIGKAGVCPAADKREGDGRTPLGAWPIRGALLRPDRGFAPPAHLPWRRLRPDDGWSDDPADPAYNRPVRRPHPFSAENLWREDGLYDVILWLGHNDSPPMPGAGSAIFLHLAGDGDTEGCIAIGREAMARLLECLSAGAVLIIK
ncbi:MAG TPA: L,D-transpeptidase family protein [Sphingomonas sp.]|nr:L,D-transpeptidase family protein [Sphingomonas sp.]